MSRTRLAARTPLPNARSDVQLTRNARSQHRRQPPAARRNQAAATPVRLYGVFAGLALLMVGNGLNLAVLGVRATAAGYDLIVVGVIMAGYFAGFLLAPSLVGRVVASVGHVRTFTALAAAASCAISVQAIISDPFTWTLTRGLFGFCAAGLYIVIESWINVLTPSTERGRVFAVYMTVSMGGLAAGQALIGVGSVDGPALLIVSSILVASSLIPVALTPTPSPPQEATSEHMSMRQLYDTVPVGASGAFLSGTAVGVLFALAAVHASSAGLTVRETSIFLAAPSIGAIVTQWPIGRLSDRLSRRAVMLTIATAATFASIVLAIVPTTNPATYVFMFILGAAMFPLYSLIVSLTADSTPATRMVATSGALIRINGLGALAGPLIAALLMSAIGSAMLFVVLAASCTAIAIHLAIHSVHHGPVPSFDRHPFVAFPARAGATAVALLAEANSKLDLVSEATDHERSAE